MTITHSLYILIWVAAVNKPIIKVLYIIVIVVSQNILLGLTFELDKENLEVEVELEV